MTKIIRPRCPSCGKVFLGAMDGKVWHKCRGCDLEFTLDTFKDYSSHKVLSLESLTRTK